MKGYVKRAVEEPLKRVIKQFPVVLITGPRQAGKSTLLQQQFKDYNYVSLDDAIARSFAQKDPHLFLKTYKTPLIIDEIQYAPSLLEQIKIEVDQNRRKMGQYLLTGSQIFPLMKGVSESLAGRIMIFQLYPLSWKEMSKLNPKDEQVVIHQMLKGFFPEFQVTPDLEPQFWHGAYLSTYLERDLRTMRNIQDLGVFQQFMVLLAARTGQLLNLSEIGKECGISQATAKDWLVALQATSVIYLLEPFHRNITKRVVKSRKPYFVDTGLLCYLLRISTVEQLTYSPFAGHIFENMVIMDKIKGFAEKGERPPCYFYRSSNKVEVDLLIDYGSYLDAYEIKFSASPNKNMASSLASLKKDLPIKNAELLTLREDSVLLGNGIVAKHWSG
ncbi:MAG: ATP-binding protein [Chlamydiia bacterium]|nr:ATP-binding protein [Chlamydiia bacterium]